MITANLGIRPGTLDWKEAMAKVDFELASLYNGYDYKNVVLDDAALRIGELAGNYG